MTTILVIYVMIAFWAFVMWKTNKGAQATFSFQKALLFGFSTATETFELEREVDEHFQVALGFLIITITWTYELED